MDDGRSPDPLADDARFLEGLQDLDQGLGPESVGSAVRQAGTPMTVESAIGVLVREKRYTSPVTASLATPQPMDDLSLNACSFNDLR